MPGLPAIAATPPTDADLIPVAGTGVVVAVHTRGPTGEAELFGNAAPTDAPAVAQVLLDLRDERPSVALQLAAEHPVDRLDPLPEAVAEKAGLSERRDLLQLRRSLPVPPEEAMRPTAPSVTTRAIDLGGANASASADVVAWLRVNNRAFAHHPDQGAETIETLDKRLGPEWRDPSGFLVADDPARPGELSGFCWTKVHAPTDIDPALGEIYVIGVDPSHRGEGLGPAFVLAGLDHLGASGLTTAMLYVDADNEPARRLYDRLGFATHRRRRVYMPAPR